MQASRPPTVVELPTRVAGFFLLLSLTGWLGMAVFPLTHLWVSAGGSLRGLLLAFLAGVLLERLGSLGIERTRARLLVDSGVGRVFWELRLPWRRTARRLPDLAGLAAVECVAVEGSSSESELGLVETGGGFSLLASAPTEVVDRLATEVALALGGLPVRRRTVPMSSTRAFQGLLRGAALFGFMVATTLAVTRLVGR